MPRRAGTARGRNGSRSPCLLLHIRTCVADDLRAGQDEKLDELLKLLPKLMK